MFKPTQSSVIYASPIFVICFGVRFDVLIFEKKYLVTKIYYFAELHVSLIPCFLITPAQNMLVNIELPK